MSTSVDLLWDVFLALSLRSPYAIDPPMIESMAKQQEAMAKQQNQFQELMMKMLNKST